MSGDTGGGDQPSLPFDRFSAPDSSDSILNGGLDSILKEGRIETSGLISRGSARKEPVCRSKNSEVGGRMPISEVGGRMVMLISGRWSRFRFSCQFLA